MKIIKKIIRKILFLNNNDNISLMYILKRWNIRFGPFFYKKKYGSIDIINELKKWGVGQGSNIFVHSAWDSFYNYTGTEDELIDALLDLIGPSGTLAMPAIPFIRKNKIFDVRKTISAAGMLTEAFRRYPNVKRSINVRHSVCAVGPLADYLTKDHHKSLTCFDEQSPYYRIIEHDFKVITLGLPHYYMGTFTHSIKAMLRNDIAYYGRLYDETRLDENHYRDSEGIERVYMSIPEIKKVRSYYSRTCYIVHRYFDKSQYGYVKLSGLNISFYNAKYTYEKLVELSRKGIYTHFITNV